jgi:hypothetical protein
MLKAAARRELISPNTRVGGQAVVPLEWWNTHGGALDVVRGEQSPIEVRPRRRSADQQWAARQQGNRND